MTAALLYYHHKLEIDVARPYAAVEQMPSYVTVSSSITDS